MTKKGGPLLHVLLAMAGLVLLYAALSYVLGTAHLLATVTSDSMKPALERGDWVLLEKKPAPLYRVNDTLVFALGQNQNVYVHRVVALTSDGGFRTKGDANPYPDGWTVPKDAVLGKVVFRIPKLGYLALWLDGK